MSVAVLATTKEAAHRAASDAYAEAKRLIADGKQAVISAKEAEDSKSLEQLRYYWGVLLPAISEQVRTPDRWTVDAWHALLKRKFLGYEIKKEVVAGEKRMRVTRRLRSLKDIKHKPMSRYIEQVTAYAVSELDVAFDGSDPPGSAVESAGRV